MNILILPGIHQKTEKWAETLIREIEQPGRIINMQRYSHWDCAAGDQCLNFEGEISRLQGRPVDIVIGLSLGVMIGWQAWNSGILRPNKAVFIGTPLTAFIEKGLEIKELAANLDGDCLFIQQSQDIVGTCEQLRQAISSFHRVEVIEIPGNNHQYKDIKLLARHIKRFVDPK